MRLNGTKYDLVNKLPDNALPVSLYSMQVNISAPYLYIMYERFLHKNGKNPGYSIKCFQGSNYIIPE